MPFRTDPKVLVMLHAYFDASYTEPGKTLVVITGCVAKASKWSIFEPEWQEMLEGAGGLDFFHMTDFEAYRGPYQGWTRERHKDVMRTVVDIINRSVEFVVSRAVVVEDFDWALPQNPHLTGHNPFGFCVIQCLQEIAAWADRQTVGGPIGYIFESGDRHGPDLDNFRRKIEGSEYFRRRFRWNSLNIVSKVELNPLYPILPLQAADVLAFEHRKEIENYYLQEISLHERRWSLKALLNGIEEIHWGRYTRAELLGIRIQERDEGE